MNVSEMNLTEIEARLAEINTEVETRSGAELDALKQEVVELQTRKKELEDMEKRNAIAKQLNSGAIHPDKVLETGSTGASAQEQRAQDFVKNRHVEMRAILSSGQIVKPTKAQTNINGLADVGNGIVDDVKAVPINGNGSYTVPLKTARGTAVDAEEGKDITGNTDPEFGYVTINPAEWATLAEVSKRIAQLSPVDYLAAVEDDAVEALRTKASGKIVAAIKASEHVEKRYSIPLDDKYLRNVALHYRPIRGMGATKLYLTQNDLTTLGDVRGTNEKMAVYEITPDSADPLSGTIKDKGLTVNYRIQDDLTDGEQLYGQPLNVDMPMWGNYTIATDEGGDYFKHRTIGVLGTQLAGADLTAVHGMQLISQGAAPAAAKKNTARTTE